LGSALGTVKLCQIGIMSARQKHFRANFKPRREVVP
jgi:hypothetical protein